jgi:hypothetical protein
LEKYQISEKEWAEYNKKMQDSYFKYFGQFTKNDSKIKQNKEQILAEVNKTSDLNIKIGTNSEKIQKMKISPIPCEIAEKMQKLKLDFVKT